MDRREVATGETVAGEAPRRAAWLLPRAGVAPVPLPAPRACSGVADVSPARRDGARPAALVSALLSSLVTAVIPVAPAIPVAPVIPAAPVAHAARPGVVPIGSALVRDAQQPPAARRVAPALTGEVVDAGLVQPPGAGLHPPHVLLELGHRAQAAHHPLTARSVRAAVAAVRAAGEVGVLARVECLAPPGPALRPVPEDGADDVEPATPQEGRGDLLPGVAGGGCPSSPPVSPAAGTLVAPDRLRSAARARTSMGSS